MFFYGQILKLQVFFFQLFSHQLSSKIDKLIQQLFFDSIVASIPPCHGGDRGSIPRQRNFLFAFFAPRNDAFGTKMSWRDKGDVELTSYPIFRCNDSRTAKLQVAAWVA